MSPKRSTPASRETITRRLADLGGRRAAVIAERREVRRSLAEVVPQARGAGLTPLEIAELTGMTRRAVYDLLAQHE